MNDTDTDAETDESLVHRVTATIAGRRMVVENPFRFEAAAEAHVTALESLGAERVRYYSYHDPAHIAEREAAPDEWEAISTK